MTTRRKERRVPNPSVGKRHAPDRKFRTTVWLSVADRKYLIDHGGISDAIHAMISAARAMDRPQPVARVPHEHEELVV